MPPLEALKVMLSMMVSRRDPAGESVGSKAKELKFAVFDISRAHFYGELTRPVYAELPAEEKAKYPGRDVCVPNSRRVGMGSKMPVRYGRAITVNSCRSMASAKESAVLRCSIIRVRARWRSCMAMISLS